MRSALDKEADEIVAELTDLGADLSLQLATKASWAWEPRPEIMRGAIRRFLATVDMDRAGIEDAMVRAIQRRCRLMEGSV